MPFLEFVLESVRMGLFPSVLTVILAGRLICTYWKFEARCPSLIWSSHRRARDWNVPCAGGSTGSVLLAKVTARLVPTWSDIPWVPVLCLPPGLVSRPRQLHLPTSSRLCLFSSGGLRIDYGRRTAGKSSVTADSLWLASCQAVFKSGVQLRNVSSSGHDSSQIIYTSLNEG